MVILKELTLNFQYYYFQVKQYDFQVKSYTPWSKMLETVIEKSKWSHIKSIGYVPASNNIYFSTSTKLAIIRVRI